MQNYNNLSTLPVLFNPKQAAHCSYFKYLLITLIIPPGLRFRSPGRTYVLSLFHIYSIFNDLCQTNYLNITPPIFIKLWLWMNDLPLVSLSLKGSCRGDQFLLVLSNSIHKIRFTCHSADGGVRQEVQVLCRTQANQITDQLSIINRRPGQ